MSRFAKVFEIGNEGHQVLVYIEPHASDEDGQDVTIIHYVTDVDPIFADAKIKLPESMEIEKVMEIFDSFDQIAADKFFGEMKTMADRMNGLLDDESENGLAN